MCGFFLNLVEFVFGSPLGSVGFSCGGTSKILGCQVSIFLSLSSSPDFLWENSNFSLDSIVAVLDL